MKKQLTAIAALITAALLSACGGSPETKSESDLLGATDSTQNVKISREVLDEMIRTLPSPIETANLITRSETTFKKELLIPSENATAYPDKYARAIALGAYGVDLGYLNLKNKVLYVVSYLESVHHLSKELKVDQFLDFSTLSNLARNNNNVDSLISLSTKNFNQIDEYLRSQNRGDLSVLILIGSWIEGLHMFSEISKEHPSEDIRKRIGEQKIIIDNIYVILNKLEHVAYYKQLKEKLGSLKKAYGNVNITYIYKEPEMKEVNGELIVTDNSESVVTINNQDLETIQKEITVLRNALLMTGH